MSERDFYDIAHEGKRLHLPRVTSILRIIDRSNALMGWATRIEREAFKSALEDALTEPGELTAQRVWDRIMVHLQGKRAHVKARDDAANIGRAAHDMIRWHTLRMLGQDAGPEPSGPDAAMRSVLAWMEWTKAVDFVPQHVERLLFCPSCAYAGTCDCIGKVEGELTVVDYKTGRAVYDEAHAQVAYYQHAARREGIRVERGLILRLPKVEGDPTFEPVPAIPLPHRYLLYIRGAWEWQRLMEQDYTGTHKMSRCEVQ